MAASFSVPEIGMCPGFHAASDPIGTLTAGLNFAAETATPEGRLALFGGAANASVSTAQQVVSDAQSAQANGSLPHFFASGIGAVIQGMTLPVPAAEGSGLAIEGAGAAEAAAASGGKLSELADDLEAHLGPGFTKIESPTGNTIFRSADGTKQIRFDLNDFHGDPNGPHINLETFSPRNLYPGDTRMQQIDNMHIYPKGP